MKCFVGLGTNLGERRKNLEQAAAALAACSKGRFLRASSVYETPALVPPGAPSDWHQPYLNAAVEIDWAGSAEELLKKLKQIEKELGRVDAPRWAPRILDLDLLLFGDAQIHESGLQVPHPEILQRAFVLDPLKDLEPLLRIPGGKESVLALARKLKSRRPQIMAIVNLTPDSFSDGGETQTLEAMESKLHLLERSGTHAIDIGAESTRPGAKPISVEVEQLRLEPVLNLLQNHRKGFFRPYLSVDTRRAETAALALSYGADCINDVSALSDPAMSDLLAGSTCDYVLMHSLSVPADPKITLPADSDPVEALKIWLKEKLAFLESKGISRNRIIFDPGIGFGKTAAQSLSLLKRIHEFSESPIRLLVGHSRKSFLKSLGIAEKSSADAATLALSIHIGCGKGVDILRVHNFESHAAAFRAEMEMQP